MTRRTTMLPLLVALLLGTIGWAGGVTTAYAGGPTSVLLANPRLERSNALYYSDSAYDQLASAVGEGAGGASGPPPGINSAKNEVRLTWLIHDMRIWRIDRVYLTPDDGIWVETVTELNGDGDVFDQPASWHRAKDDQALTALLTAAGMLGGADSRPSGAPASTTPAADTTFGAATTSAPARSLPLVPVAALGGLVIGALGTLLLLRRPRAAADPRVTLSG